MSENDTDRVECAHCGEHVPESEAQPGPHGHVVHEDCSGGTDRWDEYEEKIDELNRGLLTAYAAGFAKAVETFDFDPDFSTDVGSLRENRAVTESHYYFWDGRVKPLKNWLREQFEIDAERVQNDDVEDGDATERDWQCDNCGYRPRLVYVDEPVGSCSICGADEWSVDTGIDQEGGDD